MGLYEGDRIWTMPQYLEAPLPAEVRGRISFLGSLPRVEVERGGEQALVTVVASRFETFGMVALEALAAGAPLVTSRAGGLAEIGTPGVDCLAFASEDAGRSGGEGRQPAGRSRRGRRGWGRPGCWRPGGSFAPEVIAPQMAAFYRRVRASAGPGADRGGVEGTPNFLAYLALITFPLVAIALCAICRPPVAVPVILLVGQLFLPPVVALDAPVIPPLDKDVIPGLSALVGHA